MLGKCFLHMGKKVPEEGPTAQAVDDTFGGGARGVQ